MTTAPERTATELGIGRVLPPEARDGRAASLAGHLATFGPLPSPGTPEQLIGLVHESGLRGRGGAGFPLARKLTSVAATGRPAVVVGNAAEGEPGSSKDAALLQAVPHLVLDGLALAAHAVRATEAVLLVHPSTRVESLQRAVVDRAAHRVDQVTVRIERAADSFIAGEESAAVQRISGRKALPTAKLVPVREKGVSGKPTLVSNVETLAHLALVARHGAHWFREVGTARQPGSLLLTVSGGVPKPGVLEVAHGVGLGAVVAAAGAREWPQAVLLGGYHGTWLPGGQVASLRLDEESLAPYGATVGAGIVAVLPPGACGLAETSRVLGYLAAESAGQCGPCLNGLPALAATFGRLAAGGTAADADRVGQLAGLVERRGACHHPDGTVRLARSALRVFEAEVHAHLAGRCTATRPGAVLPVPAVAR